MKVVILCGGRGTRLREETEYKPKPLVLIGGKPILWHIMKHFSHYGYNDFVLCLGYKGEMIKDYFLKLRESLSDFTLDFNYYRPRTILHSKKHEEKWRVTFADTGENTMTGGRIARIKKYIDGQNFFLTYGDSVADIDLKKLYNFHKSKGKIATVTGIKPRTEYGFLDIKGYLVRDFKEKPELDELANGGFFVCNKKIFDYLNPADDCVFEIEPLRKLVKDSQLSVFQHKGFWYTMNTYKEAENLNYMWNKEKPAWRIWE